MLLFLITVCFAIRKNCLESKKGEKYMTELEKMKAGLPFNVRDPEVDAMKLHAVKGSP